MEHLEVVDVSLLDRVLVIASAYQGDYALEDYYETFTIPEEYMDELAAIIGDGNASMSVGDEMKVSDFGNAAGCFVNVKLTCGQTEEEIHAAHALAQKLAKKFCLKGFNEMSGLLAQALGKTDAPTAEQAAAATGKKQRPGLKVGGAKSKVPTKALQPKAKKRPSYQRK
jgi:hypothetical protein